MDFVIVGPITETVTIAVGSGVRDRHRLHRTYGRGTWRKLKGIATVQDLDGRIREAEIHWYEAHGIGKREIKVKQFIDETS